MRTLLTVLTNKGPNAPPLIVHFPQLCRKEEKRRKEENCEVEIYIF